MSDCLFCKFIDGSIPISPVFENEHVIAFDDISPQAPIHSLVVPRVHVPTVGDADPRILGELFSAAAEVAKVKGVAESGYRLVVNAGADANQSVPHLHVHVLGGRDLGHVLVGDDSSAT